MFPLLLLLLPCILLLPQSHGEHCSQQMEEFRQQMRAEMEAVMRAEAVMKGMMDQMEAKTRAEMTEIRDQIEAHTEKIETRVEKIEEQLMCEMTEKLEEQETQLAAVQTRLLNVRDLPYLMICAYRYHWTEAGATVTYDSLTADYNNSDKPNGGDGKLDIETGTFTAITPGHYTVTYSGHAVVWQGQSFALLLWKNGKKVMESQWLSSFRSSSDGYTEDQGSRTVVSGAVLYCIGPPIMCFIPIYKTFFGGSHFLYLSGLTLGFFQEGGGGWGSWPHPK